MKIEDFRNLTEVVDFCPKLILWPFDLKNNRLLAYDKLYHVVKIGLKLRPGDDKQSDRQVWKRPPSTFGGEGNDFHKLLKSDAVKTKQEVLIELRFYGDGCTASCRFTFVTW